MSDEKKAQLLNGSLDLTMLLEKAKEQHSAFSKSAKNGHIYINFTQWINEEPNDYGQHSSLLLNSTKEKKEAEGKTYIGHATKAKPGGGEPIDDATSTDLAKEAEAIDKLPF